jgi:hypothetical protein
VPGIIAAVKSRFSKNSQQSYDPLVEGITQQLVASQDPPDAASQASRDALEINYYTIADEGLMRQLDSLSVIPKQPDRTIRYEDGKGGFSEIPINGAPARPVPWALALRVAISSVTPTRFLTKKQAAMYKNRLRAEFLTIKKHMSRSDHEMFMDYINQIELYCCQAIDDAVDGQKMLALKTTGKSMRVKVNNNEPNSFGGKQ